MLIPHNPTAENIARLIFEHARSAGMPSPRSLCGKARSGGDSQSHRDLKRIASVEPAARLLIPTGFRHWDVDAGRQSRYFLRGTFSLGSQCVSRWQLIAAILLIVSPAVSAEHWTRFRGPNGTGVSPESVPTTWSDTQHLRWKAKLPGFGSSSPSSSVRALRHVLFRLRHRASADPAASTGCDATWSASIARRADPVDPQVDGRFARGRLQRLPHRARLRQQHADERRRARLRLFRQVRRVRLRSRREDSCGRPASAKSRAIAAGVRRPA